MAGSDELTVTEFYVIVALIIAIILWRGRGRRRGSEVLSPAQLGEVLERSRTAAERAERDDRTGGSAATG